VLKVGDTWPITGIRGGESGTPLVFTGTNPSVIEVSGNVIRAVGVGSAEVRVSQAGNATFNPPLERRLSIGVLP